MITIQVKSQITGPLLTGTPGPVIDRAIHQAVDIVSAEGLRRLHTAEHGTFKHPTGFYESRTVRTTRSNGYDIHDSRVMYGPWLEGVSSRNTRSRFKGYHLFRTIGQKLNTDAPMLAEPVFTQAIKELNGGN